MAEEQKGGSNKQASQATLDMYEVQEDADSEYGHLVSHLVEQEDEAKITEMWTRVFTRDSVKSLEPAVFPIGPDLLFDRSVRDSHATVEDPTGAVLFSPKIFLAKDLAGGLAAHRVPIDELLSLGQLATQVKERFSAYPTPDS